jgi:NAD(P)-dependent dehydrogenase (short-subunit alcohol dehydrogenase family)
MTSALTGKTLFITGASRGIGLAIGLRAAISAAARESRALSGPLQSSARVVASMPFKH